MKKRISAMLFEKVSRRLKFTFLLFLFFYCAIPLSQTFAAEKNPRQRAMDTMKKASEFFYGKVSKNGGYLFEYTVDMKHIYGEMPARESQIWVQDPATPGAGQAYLNAYEATGDKFYFEAADAAAKALIQGQLECGGWNYLIDFTPGSMEDWYHNEGNNSDFNEFSHYAGNATFDDDATKGPIMLLLRLYDMTRDPAYLYPLEKALNFVLEAQFPNGAWPQRFPLIGNDYDTYYTYNDNVINGNIDLLISAYMVLQKPKYLESALRGADFIIISQHAAPQSGWGYQYTYDMKLAWGRKFEPASLCVAATTNNISTLMDIYELTGNKRYLVPIPDALKWLDDSTSPEGVISFFIEENTNRPIATKFPEDSGAYESIQVTYNLDEAMDGYGFEWKNFSTKWLKNRFDQLSGSEWKNFFKTYLVERKLSEIPAGSPIYKWYRFKTSDFVSPEKAVEIARTMEPQIMAIADKMDDQGRWTEDGRLFGKQYSFKNAYVYEGPVMKNGWIKTSTFIDNINKLAAYLKLMKIVDEKK